MYSREVLHGLARAHPETRFEWWYRPHRYFRARGEDRPANVRRRLLFPSADLFHGMNQRLPRKRMRRAVATFHDLFVMTGEYSTAEFRARFTEQARDAAARADAIITVSAFTKSQVVDLLGVPAERVRVVHHGSLWPASGERAQGGRLVLHVGAIQKRKNIVRLVEAFETLDASWRLALAGSAGFGAEEIFARIERSPARARIDVLGYVPAAKLRELYRQAGIFAFPSLDEGFGIPVVEAMAAGVPVVTSNRSALPEVAGDAALLVDPEDTEALAHGLRELAANADLRRELVRRGLERARNFSWEKAAQETWQVYCELVG